MKMFSKAIPLISLRGEKKLFLNQRVQLDRNELAGSFGDMGTTLPLILGMLVACKLDSASVFILFGSFQILSGFLYGLPMPVQPLKAMAVIMISRKLSPDLLYGGGFAIGLTMLLLTLTGLLTWITKIIPKPVVRGVQFGLGGSLVSLAFKSYIPAEGVPGYFLAGASFTILFLLRRNPRYPPPLFLILLGTLYAFFFKPAPPLRQALAVSFPQLHHLELKEILTGFLLLALPQLPLSLSNSIIATYHTARDLFPEASVRVRKIGFTYAFLNLLAPFFSGIPVCHGAGGLAGYYALGGRTGGAPVIAGTFYLLAGLFFSPEIARIIQAFPLPLLGTLLLVEGIALMLFIRDLASSKKELSVALLVGFLVLTLPQGYLLGFFSGTLLSFFFSSKKSVKAAPSL